VCPRTALFVVPPASKEPAAKAGARRALEIARRNDLVGVDVGAGKNGGPGVELAEGLQRRHRRSSRGSAMAPAIAAAAAVSGLARKVRAPGPWRPSKLRLLVLTADCPRPTWSPFIPMHIEHPGSRHSAPASRNTRSRPSVSAAFFTCRDPGTTRART